MKIPKSLHKYFWDVDVKKLDPEKYPYQVISRLLGKGNIEAFKWVRKNFKEDQIKESLMRFRDFPLRSANFWALIYKIPLNKVKIFQEPYLSNRKKFWPY